MSHDNPSLFFGDQILVLRCVLCGFEQIHNITKNEFPTKFKKTEGKTYCKRCFEKWRLL
jgi:hypothetical protein